MAMGFHVLIKAPKVTRQQADPAEMLLTFDGGGGISLHEATHNTIALGSSGTGKTSSVILPALRSLLQAGYAGLVVDVKGNFTEQAKALATHYGRANDLVEFGTGRHAMPINILDGMDTRQVFEFLRILTVTPFNGQTHNLDWHLKGVRQAADCFELLRIMHAHCPEITADLGTLDQIVNDGNLATAMFKYFSKKLSVSENKVQRDLLRRVKNDEFHLCAQKEGRSSSGNTSYGEQVTWRLGAVRDALAIIREAPGVLHNFAAPGASGIDLARLIYDESKIVVLRFGVAAGGVGAMLARHMLEAFYAATYQRGLSLPESKRVFFVGDEGQDFIDLNPYNKNNDNTFTAKAREFKVIQVLGTQSVASLGSRGAGAAQVNEYLNNFSNKLILFNDDPQTLNLAERFDPSFSFQSMGQGQCLAIHFDAEKHRPVCSREGLQQAHDAVKVFVPQCQQDIGVHVHQAETNPPTLEDVYRNMCRATGDDGQEGQFRLIPAEQCTTMKDTTKRQPRASTAGNMFDAIYGTSQEIEEETSNPGGVPVTEKEPTGFRRFVGCNPSIFPKTNLKGNEIPKGWLPLLESGISMIRSMELSLQIRGFNIRESRLYVLGDNFCTGLEMLNELLAATRCTCPACGKRVHQDFPPQDDFSNADTDPEYRAFAFCNDCLCKAGFVPEKSN